MEKNNTQNSSPETPNTETQLTRENEPELNEVVKDYAGEVAGLLGL